MRTDNRAAPDPAAGGAPRAARMRPGPRPVFFHHNITIEPWMVDRLDLSGSSLVIFAMVHNAGPDGLQCSMASIGRACGTTEPAVRRNLRALENQGLVERVPRDSVSRCPSLCWRSRAWDARESNDPHAGAARG